MKSLRLGAGQFAQLSNGRAMTERGRGGGGEEGEEKGKVRTLESQDDSMGVGRGG